MKTLLEPATLKSSIIYTFIENTGSNDYLNAKSLTLSFKPQEIFTQLYATFRQLSAQCLV